MRILITICLFGFALSECDELTEMQCNSNSDCEWFEDIEYGNCSEFDQNHDACEETLGCYGAYQYPGWYSGWYCAGGQYTVDNSYCQENSTPPPPNSCEDPNQSEYFITCIGGLWPEEVSWNLNPSDTNGGAPYTEHICLYDDQYELRMSDSYGDGWNGNVWSLYRGDFDGNLVAECTLETGSFGECFFNLGTPPPPDSCEDFNQNQCLDDYLCEWVEDIEWGNCSGLSESSCDSNPNCWYDCEFYHGSCAGCCWGSCLGGSYEIDNSYCENIDFMQGDLNGDFIHNILDVLIMIDLITNNTNNQLADMNQDDVIDVLDIIVLVNIILE